MAPPPPGPHIQSAIPSDTETPFPKLVRSSTLPASLPTSSRSSSLHHRSSSHLSPEDAYAPTSPPRRATPYANSAAGNGPSADDRHRIRHNDGSRSRSRRRKRFQKLLWVKQSCKGLLDISAMYRYQRQSRLTRRMRQIPTTTPTKLPSSRTSNAIPVSVPMTSGR